MKTKTKKMAKGGKAKKTKKMQAGGSAQDRARAAQDRAARGADFYGRMLDQREGRPARQEAEYQAAQQRRREAGGLRRLAMIPAAIRRAQMRAGDRLLAASQERENAPLRAQVDARSMEVTNTLGRKAGGKVSKKATGGKTKKMAKGGTCRGMGAATRGGKYRMS